MEDESHAQGRVGLYCYANRGARFRQVLVEPVAPGPSPLFLSGFSNTVLNRLEVRDAGTRGGSSQWVFKRDGIAQLSNIHDLEEPLASGTVALFGSADWLDYEFRVWLQAEDDDGLGLVFRYVDDRNFYRFSMNRQASCRRLVVVLDGIARILWQAAASYELGRAYAAPR